jgi:hypothetical protein
VIVTENEKSANGDEQKIKNQGQVICPLVGLGVSGVVE